MIIPDKLNFVESLSPETLKRIEKLTKQYKANWNAHRDKMSFEDWTIITFAAIQVAIELSNGLTEK